MDIETYEDLEYLARIRASYGQAMEDMKAGRTQTHAVVAERLKTRFRL